MFLAFEHIYSKVFGAQHQDSVEAGWREGEVCDCSCDSHKKTRDRKDLVLFIIRHEKKKKGGQGTYPGRDKASARGKHIKRRQECLLRETRKNIMKKEKSKRQLLGLLLVLLFKEQLQAIFATVKVHRKLGLQVSWTRQFPKRYLHIYRDVFYFSPSLRPSKKNYSQHLESSVMEYMPMYRLDGNELEDNRKEQ